MTIKLYLGDCLEVMQELEDGSVDAVITDPPYGWNLDTDYTKYSGGKKYQKIVGDDKQFDFLPWETFYPNEQFWFGAENYKNIPRNNNSWLCWDKYPTDKNDKRLSGQFELIWSKKKHKRIILRVKAINTSWVTIKERAGHPTQKPIELIALLIEKYTNLGDWIFDPYMGSGTTGVACVQTGRNFIGIEIEPKYYNISEKRIAEAQLQIRMEI